MTTALKHNPKRLAPLKYSPSRFSSRYAPDRLAPRFAPVWIDSASPIGSPSELPSGIPNLFRHFANLLFKRAEAAPTRNCPRIDDTDWAIGTALGFRVYHQPTL